jgi:hypothetical protein
MNADGSNLKYLSSRMPESGAADRRVHDWKPGQLFAPDKECP